ncbi:hypothetical protein NLJ89_g9764 [Agrocybe chaxingu]|uniref:Uncharacterized protein n=1 Tax=Agrocybe chaxingu TaxID=84603 RepID=A0A9W8JSY9_9AGAR|nr:hypothetical protein NLJ89_g9764 [Agrocybe chaxingu]
MYFLRSLAKFVSPIESLPNFDFGELLWQSVAREREAFEVGADADDPEEPTEVEGGSEMAQTRSSHGDQGGKKRKAEADEAGARDPELDVCRSHQCRRAKRSRIIAAEGSQIRPEVKAHILAASEPIPTDLNLEGLPTTCCGYRAMNYKRRAGDEIGSLEELLDDGFRLVPWDGYGIRPFEDANGKTFGALVGQPNDPSYRQACEEVYQLFLELGQTPEFQSGVPKNVRGRFPVLNVGYTHGKGTEAPVNLHEPKNGRPSKHSAHAEALRSNKSLERIATFASSALNLWAPKLFDYCEERLNKLRKFAPHLRPNFPKSIFPSMAINCGPKAWTRKHRDCMNLPFGLCAITALGHFDPKCGGHMALPDLKLVIEFPPCSTMILPSSTLFFPGGLFRYVDNGFMTEKALKATNKKEHERVCSEKATRWKMGLDLFSTRSELEGSAQDERTAPPSNGPFLTSHLL